MLIVGLGNPGTEYEHTYHNAGFLFVDWVAEKYGAKWRHDKKANIDGAKALDPESGREYLLLKPLAYMNLSGTSVLNYLKRTKKKDGAEPVLVVVHDDSDIELGNFKIAFGRGSAGHKGVESMIAALGTNAFRRVRIGVRAPERTGKADQFVLKKMSAQDKADIVDRFPEILSSLHDALEKEPS